MSKHFKHKEFRCKCCGAVEVDPFLFLKLETVREKYGKPMIVNSGFRCEKHNEEVGGKPSSAHLTGEAADIKCTNSRDRFNLIQSAVDAGFKRIGLDSKRGFIHMDISKSLPQRVFWTYD